MGSIGKSALFPFAVVSLAFAGACLLLLTACAEQSPDVQIELKLEEYREKVMELSDTMKLLRDGEITPQAAQERLGDDFVQQLAALEQEIRSLVETHRDRIGDDKAAGFLKTLEDYRKLGRVN